MAATATTDDPSFPTYISSDDEDKEVTVLDASFNSLKTRRTPAPPLPRALRHAPARNRKMEGGQSLLHLLTFSGSEPQLESAVGEKETPPTREPSASVKAKYIKEENWSSEEDMLLIQAWAKTCLSAVTRVDERSSSCWRRISDHYHTHKKSSWPERTANALSCRYDTISSETSNFCGCLQQIIYLNQSGVITKKMEEDALLFYIAIYPDKKPFTLMHCYHELKKYPKWQTFPVPRKKQKTSDASPCRTSNYNDFGAWTADLATEQRPLGVKRAREHLLRGKASASDGSGRKKALEIASAQKLKKDETKDAMKNAHHARAFELEEKRIALQERELVRQEREEARKQLELEEKIMSMDTSRMSVGQKQYYKDKQEEIIARRYNTSG